MRFQAFIVHAAALARLGQANPLPGSESGHSVGDNWYPQPTDTPDTQYRAASDSHMPRGHSWYIAPSLPTPVPIAQDGKSRDCGAAAQPEPAQEEGGHSWYHGWPVHSIHTEGGHSWYGRPKTTPTSAAEP